jgi:hypothetical protein
MPLKYVITGCGRSGTVYMAKLLCSVGISCGHESIFTNKGLTEARLRLDGSATNSDVSGGGIQENIEADSSYMAAPFLQEDILGETNVIHVVRNPIKVINSFVESFHYFWSNEFYNPPGSDPEFKYQKFIYSHVPELYMSMDRWTRACLYYVRWNQMIEKLSIGKNHVLHRLENDVSDVFKFINVEPKEYYKEVANKSEYEITCNIKDIPKSEIKDEFVEMSHRYEYFIKL